MGLNNLMSNSDGLGPFTFCQKLERTRLVKKELDERAVYLPPESAFPLCFFLKQVLFLVCTLT